MYRRNDPRLRQRLNEISQTIETANETAQARVFTFGQDYISPCFSSIYASFQPCIHTCFPPKDQRGRRIRNQSRARPELNFDFYDDWDEDETEGLLGWGDEEYDNFIDGLGGYGGTTQQPARQRAMSYGAQRDAKGRKISSLKPYEAADESVTAQGASYFGFFGKLTGKLGKGKGLRYKPSAAGLQEHPTSSRKHLGEEGEALMTDDSDADAAVRKHGRKRSGTTGSEQTTDSFSSRGDLFPSEDEDDAIPIDDEFAMVLERRTTNSGQDDESNASRSGDRPSLGSRRSTRARSDRSTPRSRQSLRTASIKLPTDEDDDEDDNDDAGMVVVPTLNELEQEEERARIEEEAAIDRRREAAQILAAEKGLSTTSSPMSTKTSSRSIMTPAHRRDQVDIDGMSTQDAQQNLNAVSAALRLSSTSPAAENDPSSPLEADEPQFGDYQKSSPPVISPHLSPASSSFEAAKLPRFDL